MRTACRAIVLLIGLAAGLLAQESTGNVYGRVFDEQHGALPGVSATLTGPTTGPQTTTTDPRGEFRFLHIPPGRYVITASLSGFADVRQENVVVTLGRNTEFTFSMKLSSVKETVTISAETPLIDTRKTETGATFYETELQSIPTARDIWVVMQQVPGVLVDRVNVAGNQSASQADFVGKGTYQSTYIYDGVNVTDQGANGFSSMYFDFDAFQELQIATGGSDLTLNSAGVTLNVVTKRGSNAFKGSGRWFYAPHQIQSDNTPAEIAAQGPDFVSDKTRFVREYGAEVGGPIIKDRLWFWAAASRQDINLDHTGELSATGTPLQSNSTLENWNGKLNVQVTSSNAATFLYNRNDKLVDGRGASVNRPQETTYRQRGPGTILKAEDSHVFSPNLFASAFVAYIDEPYSLIPEGGLDKQVFFDSGGLTAHNSYKYLRISRPQHQADVKGSKFFATGSVSHELKFGFGYRHTVSESYSAWPGDQIFGSEISSDSTYAAITRAANTKFKMNYYNAYVGDTMTTGNLTVNVGVRYDYQQAANLPSSVAANPTFPDLLPAVNYAGDKGYPVTYRNFQPRIGLTYALGEEKKTLLRGSYSRFADQLRNVIYNVNGLPIVSGYYYYWNDANHDHIVQRPEVDLADGVVSFYHIDPSLAPSPSSVIARNYQVATTDEFIIGADHEILPEFAASVAYTYRHIGNLQRSPLLGASASDYSLYGMAHGTVVGSNGFSLTFNEPYYGLNLPDAPGGNLYENQPGAYQRYQGVEVQLVKRLSNKWMMRASFGYNDWRQYLTAASIDNPNNLLGGTNQNGGLAVPNDSSNPFYDAKWQFNVSGLYQFPFGINAGANFFARQGYSNPFYVRVRPRDVTGGRYNIQIGQVDDYRLPNVYQLDLRLEKGFQIGQVNVTGSLDLFNATNGAAITSRDNKVADYDNRGTLTPNATFDQALVVQSPRILRLGARVSF